MICLVRLTQIFATVDRNIKMFSKIAIFLQNQFNKKLICDDISKSIFKLFQQTKDYFKAMPIYTICTINISFYIEKTEL